MPSTKHLWACEGTVGWFLTLQHHVPPVVREREALTMRTYSRGPEKAPANQGTAAPLTGRHLLYGDGKRNRRRKEWRGAGLGAVSRTSVRHLLGTRANPDSRRRLRLWACTCVQDDPRLQRCSRLPARRPSHTAPPRVPPRDKRLPFPSPSYTLSSPPLVRNRSGWGTLPDSPSVSSPPSSWSTGLRFTKIVLIKSAPIAQCLKPFAT